MTEKTIHIFNDKKEIAEAFAGIIATGIRNLSNNAFYAIALSGGSTPREVFKHLASVYANSIDWSKIRIFWGDERCVPPDHEDSNFNMARKALLDSIAIPDTNIHRIKGENDPKTEAKDYESLVRKLVPLTEGIPAFDLIMLGLGEDGHTASIFPQYLSGMTSQNLFIPAVHPVSKQNRISATGTLINRSKQVIFLVTGSSKAERVAQIIEQKPDWEKLPAGLIRPEDGHLTWMLDREAAKLLKKNAEE